MHHIPLQAQTCPVVEVVCNYGILLKFSFNPLVKHLIHIEFIITLAYRCNIPKSIPKTLIPA